MRETFYILQHTDGTFVLKSLAKNRARSWALVTSALMSKKDWLAMGYRCVKVKLAVQ